MNVKSGESDLSNMRTLLWSSVVGEKKLCQLKFDGSLISFENLSLKLSKLKYKLFLDFISYYAETSSISRFIMP